MVLDRPEPGRPRPDARLETRDPAANVLAALIDRLEQAVTEPTSDPGPDRASAAPPSSTSSSGPSSASEPRPRAGPDRDPGRRPRPARGPARARQDADRPVVRPGARAGLRPDPVHPRPAALRRGRRAAVRPADRRDGVPARAGLHPAAARRRDQPDAARRPRPRCWRPWARARSAWTGQTRPLPQPFIVLATDNPIEYEGTYELPEAQLDRFLMRLRLGYLRSADEVAMLQRRLDRAADERRARQVARPPGRAARDARARWSRSRSRPTCSTTWSR